MATMSGAGLIAAMPAAEGTTGYAVSRRGRSVGRTKEDPGWFISTSLRTSPPAVRVQLVCPDSAATDFRFRLLGGVANVTGHPQSSVGEESEPAFDGPFDRRTAPSLDVGPRVPAPREGDGEGPSLLTQR
jgi:hypothetical protein